MSGAASLQSLIYKSSDGKPSLQVLDQLLIPSEKVYVDVPNVQTTWSVIRNMQIRGAPLIAVVASLGMAVDLKTDIATKEMESIESMHGPGSCGKALLAYIKGKLDYLGTSRPTAVNLFHSLADMNKILNQIVESTVSMDASPRVAMVDAIVEYAERFLKEDVEANRQLGAHGADAVLEASAKALGKPKDKVRVMTICNTGSLATAEYGTALGVVRALRDRKALESVVALETRPYNQGSRLTAFEMVEEDMPGSILICDSMAAAWMSHRKDTHPVDACVVGADRVCSNGDTANKIGTFALSLAAAAHKIPFYVAAPLTTLDADTATGSDIPIEERPAKELLETSRAPSNVNVWNPAFDVTPAKFITGIITEKGVLSPQADGTFDVAGFLKKHRA